MSLTLEDIRQAIVDMDASPALEDGDELAPGVTYRIINGEPCYLFKLSKGDLALVGRR